MTTVIATGMNEPAANAAPAPPPVAPPISPTMSSPQHAAVAAPRGSTTKNSSTCNKSSSSGTPKLTAIDLEMIHGALSSGMPTPTPASPEHGINATGGAAAHGGVAHEPISFSNVLLEDAKGGVGQPSTKKKLRKIRWRRGANRPLLEKAIQLVTSGRSTTSVAQEFGIPARTLRRYVAAEKKGKSMTNPRKRKEAPTPKKTAAAPVGAGPKKRQKMSHAASRSAPLGQTGGEATRVRRRASDVGAQATNRSRTSSIDHAVAANDDLSHGDLLNLGDDLTEMMHTFSRDTAEEAGPAKMRRQQAAKKNTRPIDALEQVELIPPPKKRLRANSLWSPDLEGGDVNVPMPSSMENTTGSSSDVILFL